MGVDLDWDHLKIVFIIIVLTCKWILNKVADKIRHYRFAVTGGKLRNSAEEMVGVCVVVQCMLYQWVCAF